MRTNRHRHSNTLPFGSILLYGIVAAFFAITGLSYLYLKNQLSASGTHRRLLEQELHELSVHNRELDSQIAALTSSTALQKRLKDGFIKMVDIPAGSLVHLHLLPDAASRSLAADDTRDTANPWRTISHEADGESALR